MRDSNEMNKINCSWLSRHKEKKCNKKKNNVFHLRSNCIIDSKIHQKAKETGTKKFPFLKAT